MDQERKGQQNEKQGLLPERWPRIEMREEDAGTALGGQAPGGVGGE